MTPAPRARVIEAMAHRMCLAEHGVCACELDNNGWCGASGQPEAALDALLALLPEIGPEIMAEARCPSAHYDIFAGLTGERIQQEMVGDIAAAAALNALVAALSETKEDKPHE